MIVGWLGGAVTLTTVAAEVRLVQPLAILRTVYEPAVEMVTFRVVAPVLQRLPLALDDRSVTEPPVQKSVELSALMVGVAGKAVTATVVVADTVELQPFAMVRTV